MENNKITGDANRTYDDSDTTIAGNPQSSSSDESGGVWHPVNQNIRSERRASSEDTVAPSGHPRGRKRNSIRNVNATTYNTVDESDEAPSPTRQSYPLSESSGINTTKALALHKRPTTKTQSKARVIKPSGKAGTVESIRRPWFTSVLGDLFGVVVVMILWLLLMSLADATVRKGIETFEWIKQLITLLLR